MRIFPLQEYKKKSHESLINSDKNLKASVHGTQKKVVPVVHFKNNEGRQRERVVDLAVDMTDTKKKRKNSSS